LERSNRQYSDYPELEDNVLLLMALERENLVSHAYKEQNLFKSIELLKISSEEKSIVKKAIAWIWKDEQMHTTYVHSQLLDQKKRSRFLDIFSFQMGVPSGGWASSVICHHRFS
jgi:hypothetical protein